MAEALAEVRYVRSKAMSAILPASGRNVALLLHGEWDGVEEVAARWQYFALTM